MNADHDKLTFRYVKCTDYRVVAVNGAHGGVTGRSDFKMDIFLEAAGLPDSVSHSVTPDGLGPEIGREPPPPNIVREVQVGVVLQ
jgi:hypothetical protein